MKKKFIKMHGLGNDFAVFDGRKDGFSLSAEQILALGDRRRGIGFDQVVLIVPAKTAGKEAFLHIYNRDGQEIPCGNATRCVAAVLLDEAGKDTLELESAFGALSVWRAEGGKIGVDMGAARLEWADIPLSENMDTLTLPELVKGLPAPVAVSVGNPHAVFFVENVDNVTLEDIGPVVECHALFPAKTNVEVVQVLSPDKIRMRVWERGTGVTEACGTGACAVAVAGVRRGLTARKVTIVLDGGELDIEWREEDGHVLMTGDAVTAYWGEVAL